MVLSKVLVLDDCLGFVPRPPGVLLIEMQIYCFSFSANYILCVLYSVYACIDGQDRKFCHRSKTINRC